MKFPPYWAKGTSGDCSCWCWSFESLVAAQTSAPQAAQQLAARFGAEGFPKKEHGYYADRPLREEVLHEIKDSTGAVAAVVTRNSYGCQVLNTAA